MSLNQAKSLNIDQSNLYALYVVPTSGNYVIPAFQRQYVWKNEHISDFFETLINEKETYLGTVILRSIANSTHEIVDGQQRAITLQIFAAAVANYCKKSKFEHSMRIHDHYKKINVSLDNIDDVTDNRVTVGRSISAFFSKHISGDEEITKETYASSDETVVKQAYIQLYSLLETFLVNADSVYEELKRIYINLKTKYVSLIVVNSEDIAYEIFESVNSKGEELDASDLLKNSIIRNSGGSDELIKEWDEIYKNVINSKVPLLDFIQYYWSAVHDYSSKRKLFTAIKSKQIKADDWMTLSSELLLYSRYLNTLRTGDRSEFEAFFSDRGQLDDIFYGIITLRSLPAKTWVIPYLSLFYHAHNNGGKLTNINRNFVTFLSKYTVCYFNLLSRPSNDYFSRVHELARKIRQQSSNPQELQTVINIETIKLKKLVEDVNQTQLKNAILEIRYSKNASANFLIKYYMHLYESTLLVNTHNLSKDFTASSLEHILPQDPNKWQLNKNQTSTVVNCIGNLTLLLPSANKAIGNSTMSVKIETFKEAGYEHTRRLRIEDWPSGDITTISKTINKRADEIAEGLSDYFYKILR